MSDFFDNGAGASPVDVPAFFDSGVLDAIIGLVSMGVLVSIGSSRDRGAISLGVTRDGKSRREYFRHSDEAADFLRLADAAVRGTGFGQTGGDLPPTQRPTRAARKAR